ncbi:hypothetical protein CSE45_1914 [Citreicella sp. SE45]|nr:hypothetical protein CSE45_1914 [Citreicella sp. SE45]
MTPPRLLVLIALPRLAATAAPTQNVTVTGNNGGTIATSRDCARASGSATCATSSTLTSPAGEPPNRGPERNRTSGDGQSKTPTSRTGPGGGTSGRTHLVTR